MQPDNVVGWDIGGAHIKIAIACGSESISGISQSSCPLWQSTDSLHTSFHSLLKKFGIGSSLHTVTMTGELVDYFNDRLDGVRKLVLAVAKCIQKGDVKFYAGDNGFVDSQTALDLCNKIASANWLASSSYIANKISNALFVDIGSTTSDIVRIENHKVIYDGYTDAERLYAQELIYCGVVRTPIFALCKSAPTHEKFIPIMNEYFSNAADVYRLTGELPIYADQFETADHRDKDEICSAVRLARMFGHDAKLEDMPIWKQVAEYVREQQLQMLINACRKQLVKFSQPQDIPLVGAGVGRFLIREIAERFNKTYIDFESLCKFKKDANEFNVGDCASAASVACLGYQRYLAK